MRKIAVFLFALLLFSRIIFADIIINEIMAKPIADEALNEYIEIYNNGSPADVKNWSIGDDSDNDIIEGGLYNKEGTIIPAFGYAIITDETTRVYDNFNVSSNAVRLYIDDASIGRYGLSNNAETIYLYDANGNLVDKASYNKTSDGLSWSFLNGSWFLASPTPGYNNNGTIISFVSDENCDFSIEIILGKTIFNNDEFSFRLMTSKIIGDATNITGRASINDLYGTIVKEYEPWNDEPITRQRTSSNYTPNLEEGSYILNANLTTACIDSNLENNFDSKLITIKGQPLKTDSEIKIEEIYLGRDKKAKFGQTIRFKLNIYKGSTSKNSIDAWIESKKGKKVSEQLKTNVYGKYRDYSLTLPLQIVSNCDKEFKDGSYYIIAEGLDLEVTKKIEIEGTSSLCKIATEESTKKFEYELLEIPEKIEDVLEAKVKLTNNENKAYKIKIWSYIYRGKNSYSGDREENKKEFLLLGKTSEIVELKNRVTNAEPGNYKYKVVINKDEQKTNREIIKDIIIENRNNEDSTITEKDSEIDKETSNPEKNKIAANAIYELKMQPKTIYESVDEKIKKLAIIFLIAISVIFNIILLWRR